MRTIKWVIVALLLFMVLGLGHYTLPQKDVVRILDAYEKRQDFGVNGIFWAKADSGSATSNTRDVRFIDTVQPNGNIMVYRNEDTGFSWPFLFKFDSANLNAEAKELVSTKEARQWVMITHYGWRSELMSIYPNAVSLRAVDGPDVRFIPWFNIIFFIVLGLIGLGIFRMLQRFKRRRIDPVLEDMEETFDSVGDRAGGVWTRVTGLFQRK